ncbi:AAA family ATPase [Nocardioides humilatus]|uniref:AAA family ATPase n=1 Tax=Nocardioides humilatus TaxID=2607660 RepID=A0A5B1L8B1_9ACTN|nr:AAA family ATPase [Nocardioides humilatus]KAA1416428.1 AAA family ATPase [Nocardioides humilatus]
MPVSGRLVGRGPALGIAASALSGALKGSGRVLLVGGEPGIGKTALARAVTEDAWAAGAQVVWSACPPMGAPAYWPWTQVVRELATHCPVPAAAERLLGLAGHATDPDDATARFELHDAVSRLLADAARLTPVLMVIDDLQWADKGSLDLLDDVARGLGGRAVLLLGTYRDLEAPEALDRVVTTVDGITLGGLDDEAVLGLITSITGTAPALEDASALRDRTGGNPLFVREIARLIVASSTSASAAPLPATVAETLRRRLGALGEDCRELLAVVAVADTGDAALLASVAGIAETAAGRLLSDAATARVLHDPSTLGVSDSRPFVHDLYREAVLADLEPARRRALEGAVGHALAHRGDAAASRVARHLVASLPDGDGEAVGSWVVRAAEEATAALAHEEAVRWYRTVRSPDAGPELLIALGEAELRAGDPEAATTFRAAADAAQAVGDGHRLASAALGLHRIGARGDHDELLALLDSAIAAVPLGSAERARLLAAVARDRRHSRWSAADCRAPAEEAVAEAREYGDPRLVAECLLALHDALWEPGTAEARLPVVEQIAAAAADAGDAELVATATVLRAACRITLNDPRGVADLATYCLLAEALGHARGRWEALSRRATLALITGAVDDAARLAAEAQELGTRIGIPDAIGVNGTLTWPLSQFTGTRGQLVDQWRDIDLLPLRGAFLAAGARAAGDHDEARRHALTVDLGAIENSTDLEFPALAAEALVAAGATPTARASYDSLLLHAGTNVLVGGCASYWGPVDLFLGQLAVGLGDPAGAARHLRAAEQMATTLGAPLWAEYAGRLLRELDQDGDRPRLSRDGGVWTVRWAGDEAHVPDSKGVRDLAQLLDNPGREIAATELMSGRPAAGADPVLDDRAKAAYRRRLDDLDAEIDDATLDNDLGRVERAQDERDALIAMLTSAVGLGGRDRRLGDDAERARKAVSARIRDAIGRIAEVHPELGRHLADTVRTGNACCYQSVVR